MKSILVLFIAFFSITSYAQHPDLQNTGWYLTNMTIDGNYSEPLYDPLSFPYVILEFWSGGFSYTVNQTVVADCEIGFAGYIYFTSTDLLDLTDITFYSNTTNCTSYITDFMNMYMNFYDYTSEIFSYTISNETDGSKTLTILNYNGDEINFSDTYLNIAPSGMYETWWYLHNLIIDSTEHIPPINEELPDVPMIFHDPDYSFKTQGCVSFLWADASFHIDTSMIYLYNLAADLFGCSISENDDYQNLYFNFYWEDFSMGQYVAQYGYAYTENGSEKTLIITDDVGDRAIYKNFQPIGVDENEVTPEASFTNDLGADSLDTVELIINNITCIWS